ncbi:MAG: RDD family protein [Nocardioidaceae bacterium]|nr:RDD family protein [Nocardioidaceae bacterium]
MSYPSPPPGPPSAGYGVPTPYASWIQRVGGYLLDILILIPAYIVIIVGAGLASTDSTGLVSIGLVLTLLGYVAVFGLLIWNMIIRQGRTGWSIGKQVVGIRLISEQTGQPLGAGMTFVRLLAHFLDSLACYLGWLWPLWDQKRQTFADKLLRSVVVVQKKA